MKFFLIVFIFLSCARISMAQVNPHKKPINKIDYSIHKDELKKNTFLQALKIPMVFTMAGLYTLSDDAVVSNTEVREERNEHIPDFRSHADDYLQFAPIVAVYGLNLAGVKGKNDMVNRTALLIKTELLVSILTYSLKKITIEPRPDSGTHNSFPSGHTAQAFAAATFMAKEYGEKNIWYSIGAYSMATTVGVMRVMNNRHWVSDVLVGAGIGILSTNLVYLTHQYRWGKRKRGVQTIILPTYDGQTGSINIIHRFG